MGNRANIVIRADGEQVCLYTHWDGEKIGGILYSAMRRGQDRWFSPSHLSRIIFCEMIKDDVLGLTGFGISASIQDGGHNVYFVDVNKQTVQYNHEIPKTFAEFSNITLD